MSDNDYIISITKEELAAMPTTAYDGAITVVDTPSVAHAALRVLGRESIVGFDTETKPCFRKGTRNQVALLQLSTADRCFLFRLNKIGICADLKKFLENPDILKIGLSVHDDFAAIRRTEEFEPGGFVDLQEMVRHFDIADISLQKIYAIIFGERISKGQRLTNWEADTLTEAQQNYASLDAWACLKLYKYLTEDKFNPLESPYRHLRPLPEAPAKKAAEPAPEPKREPGARKSKNAKRRRRVRHARKSQEKSAAADSLSTNTENKE